jgi:hypothetical protein
MRASSATTVALRFGCLLALAAFGCTKAIFQPVDAGQGGAGSGGGGPAGAGGDGQGGDGGTGGGGGTVVGGASGGGSSGTGGSAGTGGGGVAGTGGSAATGGRGGTGGSSGASGTGGTGGSAGRGGSGGTAGTGGGGTAGTGSGGAGVMPTVAGQIVISELLHDVPGSDDNSEWYEIYNPSTTVTYNLMGCQASDRNSPVPITTPLVVPPGAFRTLGIVADVGFMPDFVYGAGIKFDSNAPDSARILCNGIEIDVFAYDMSDATDITNSGHTFSVDPRHYTSTENDLRANWCLGTTPYMMGTNTFYGTPGAPNPQCP